ncbi:hypothetical protein DFH08DRAFT_947466 [Mycena albidolilacea]|uniref:Uncharacterized protein n=1 Tax=Mycena albidolilacea TaxID=1033008 RepID=A0AAD7AVH1_9AGAR|nr:hypothetical protein DFH08DRAFT_947466 [Mycena albidolilacea]
MGVDSQPEPSTSRLPGSSTQAVLDFLRIGTALDAAAPKPVEKQDNQPSVAALAALGIKVRDFGYESTLPPVTKYVRRQPQTVRHHGQPFQQNAVAGPSSAPAVRPPTSRRLKRMRQDGTEVEDLGYGFIMGVARRGPDEESRPPPRKLQRTETEAQLPQRMQASLPPRRGNALLSLEEEAALRAAAYDVFGGSQPPDSQSQPWSQSQSQGYAELYSQGYSQDMCTDGVPTPLLTPQGSLPRIGDSDSPPLVPTEPVSEQPSTSRVRSPEPISPTPARLRRPSPQGLGTGTPTPPVSPPALAPSLAPAPIAAPPVRTEPSIHPLLRTFSSLSTLSSPLSEPPPSQPQQASVVVAQPRTPTPSPPPRYQLRKRTGAAPPTPVRSTKRRARPAPRREESLTLVIQS